MIPAEPEAWSDLERIYGDKRAFGALAAAHEKRLAALEARLEARYAEAAERIRLGDFFRSRSLLLKNVVEAPPSRRFAPHVAKALELYPPGLHGLTSVTELRAWLDWLLDLDRLGLHPIGSQGGGKAARRGRRDRPARPARTPRWWPATPTRRNATPGSPTRRRSRTGAPT